MLAPKADPRAVARDHGIVPTYTYSYALTGFAGSISDVARQGLLKDLRVVSIRKDQEFRANETEPAPSWGLDRIDQRHGRDGSYTYAATGEGVTVYIIDTGIRYSHADFGGRASFGYDAYGWDGSDCVGHGTHVAGTVGGTRYGVAKDVHLVSVRVLDCAGNGTTSSVLAGLEWVLASRSGPAVANLSLSGDADGLLDEGIRRLYQAGILATVAAGNNGADACAFSPGRVAEAMTVAASTLADDRAYFSNYGDCVDFFAPGLAIASDWFSSDTASNTLNGTSTAAPHVAGAAALYLERHPGAPAQEVAAALAAASTKRAIHAPDTRNNDLVYTLADSAAPPNAAPMASFTSTCAGLTCTFTDGSRDVDGSIAAWRWDFGDGAGSSAQNPAHAFAAVGAYTVTLTVTDNLGATGLTATVVSADEVTTSNQPPTPAFTFACARLTCSFADGSTDPDGSVAGVQWDFGDGQRTLAAASSSTGHTFAAGASYAVTLAATDNAGAAQTIVHDVPVGVRITATAHRQKGHRTIDVSWQGAESARVDVYVNGILVAAVDAAAGTYTYAADGGGRGSYSVRACEAGTTYCSRDQVVTL